GEGCYPGGERQVAVAATASPLTVARDISLADYWRFHRAVATAQLAAWLPQGGRFLVDISGPHGRCAAHAARAGDHVLRVGAQPPAASPGAGHHVLRAGPRRQA